MVLNLQGCTYSIENVRCFTLIYISHVRISDVFNPSIVKTGQGRRSHNSRNDHGRSSFFCLTYKYRWAWMRVLMLACVEG